MRDTKEISVARDYSPYPGPRFAKQGKYSGEKFREVLVEALRKHEHVVVDLDGTTGFGSSFLDEAFGGLVRAEGMDPSELSRRLTVKSNQDSSYGEEVRESISQARVSKLAHAD